MNRGLLAALVLLAAGAVCAEEPRAALDYFEREVRPILVDHCQKCHGAGKQESDLRLDSREALLKGGVSGPAIVSGQPGKSTLIAAIRHEGDIKMPPKSKLTEAQIAAVTHWVASGAVWPSAIAVAKSGDSRLTHWAFQPVRDPPVPVVAGDQSANPIDAFVLEKLAAAGLSASPPADRRTLIRRMTVDLTGLPPTAEEVEAFERDSDPKAAEALLDRLLASPHYGEQQARHWLDVARYSDTKGYVYGREQRFWLHAWVYRDWVVRAFNDDLPYDRFLLLQIAADQAAPDDKAALSAMGFLTLGRRFLGVQRDIIDDRIDVVTRGTMGLTVGCARCHDHKYDPIPTRDYYSLYGVFQSSAERSVTIAEPAQPDEAYQKFAEELEKRRKNLADGLAARRLETADHNRSRTGDYLAAQLELHNYPPEGFDQIFSKTDLLPTFVHRWEAYLADAKKRSEPIFVPWHAYSEIPARDFATKAAAVTEQLNSRPDGAINPLVAGKFAAAPTSMAEVAARYGELFAKIEAQWKTSAPAPLADPAAEALRQVLYSRAGPCEVPDEPIVNIEYFVDSGSCDALWKLQNEVDNWILQGPPSMRMAVILTDRNPPIEPHVFRRGNPVNLGEEIPRQFVEVLAGPDRRPFASGSGRLELAQAIIDPKNPLTARVIVNRIWAHHFGSGLVRTPSDFGTRADPPSHPKLHDWLASRFIEDGWSITKLHRRIMTSRTYQQASGAERGAGSAEQGVPSSVDPENRLLWRQNPRRLSFEEMRDALLAAGGQLDRTLGGRAGDLFARTFVRRSLYGTIDRQFLPSTLRMFDFANPDLHIPLRSETTVPQQALFFLNHPLLIGYAQTVAKATASAATDEERVRQLFRRAYQREATADEIHSALALISAAAEGPQTAIPVTATAWQYGYGAFDEKMQRVTGFKKLPHFTGTAWQGGSGYPDGKLGWLQLTAEGGHPGNDLAHAVVRRWTAPRDMQVRVTSTLIHEPKEGKGVRGFLVSSRGGLIKQVAVHNGREELNVDQLDLQAGDTLDFVADMGDLLSHNQFLWKAQITAAGSGGLTFDSQRDFGDQPTPKLTAWEQLAQVLLSANEFVFVD